MRILHISHGCLPEMSGGVESYLQELIAEQRRVGDEIHLLAGSHDLRPATVIEPQEIAGETVHRLYRSDLYFDLWARSYHAAADREIEAFLRELAPDVVHVHQWIRMTSNLVEIAARLGIPAVVTAHDVYTSCPRAFRVRRDGEACYRRLSVESCLDCVPKFGHETDTELAFGIELFRDQYRNELERAAAVLVSDPATSDLLAETTDIEPDRFETLPLPYGRRFADLDVVPSSPTGDEPFRFAYWGVLTYRKGAQFMVRAFADLCRRGLPRPAELHLFGGIDTHELEADLHATADGLPVVFHGRYEYSQLASAGIHMGIFPMLCFETWGFVLDECFELGIPCITTENGALARRAGEAAIRVPPKDERALRDAMASVLADARRHAALSAQIPELPPTTDRHAAALRTVYERSVERGPRDVARIPAARRAEWIELQRESAIGR
ncbi:MAG: glycosyltransferase, partial [Planctomycetes bacterium]|nr:glycosyltransferase [Planctomycetota bacterium]